MQLKLLPVLLSDSYSQLISNQRVAALTSPSLSRSCDKRARYVDTDGDPAKASAFFCSEKCWTAKWGKKHYHDLLYRLGNSPRTGACGYPSATPHPDFR